MKRKLQNKQPQVFRLRPDLIAALSKHSAKSNISKTRIVEIALNQWLAVKR